MTRRACWFAFSLSLLAPVACRKAEDRRNAAPAASGMAATGSPSASSAPRCAPPAALAAALAALRPDCAVVALADYANDEAPARCSCVVAPSSEVEIATVVRGARATGTALRVRGGAHSANHSTLPAPSELLLSTARLDTVSLEATGTVTAGAGVPVVALSKRLADFGLMLPVVNDGWSGPTVGGYVSAGGMGARSEKYGGLWENVTSVTLVDGTGTKRTLGRDDADFLWLFGSMGQLGVIVSAVLDTVPTSGTAPTYEAGSTFRLPPAELTQVGSTPVSSGPRVEEALRWFTLLVPKARLHAARKDLAALQSRFDTRLSFRNIYEYEFAFRRRNPPLFFGEDGPFVGIGIWAELQPQADVRTLAEVERGFTRLVRDGGYRRYIQSEVTRGPTELRAYFGDELYERLREVKRRFDPDGIMNPGTVFERAQARPPARAGDLEQPTVSAIAATWAAPVADTFTSSPRVADLDGDGVADVAIGAGVERRRGALHAISGATGRVLWSQDLGAEIYPTPALVDVTGDGIPEVFATGRMNDLRSYDGRTGKPRHSLRAMRPKLPDAHLNTPVVVDDLDGDSVRDLLVAQSGGNDDKRPPGSLHFVSAKGLRHLGSFETPDGLETYAVPAVRRLGERRVAVIVGTGGETIGGSLHRIDVALEPKPAMRARWSTPAERAGFVASPLWIELPSGEWLVVGVSFDGVVVALDAETGAVRWKRKYPGFIVYASPSAGTFGEGAAGVVVVRSRGTSLGRIGDEARISWIRLEDGEALADEPLGVFSTSTPVVADLDGDGVDEVLAVTMRDVTSDTFSRLDDGFGNAKVDLIRFEGRDRARSVLATFAGVAGGTPTLADVDGDGKLDVLVAHGTGVSRLALDAPATARVRVGRYRGLAADTVVALRRPPPSH